jgi:hypothetical protein
LWFAASTSTSTLLCPLLFEFFPISFVPFSVKIFDEIVCLFTEEVPDLIEVV